MFPLAASVQVRRPPLVTMVLIGINVAVFFVEAMLPPDALEHLMRLFGVVPAYYSRPDLVTNFPVPLWLPLFTSMFLHGGFAHILGNMWTLWIFGPAIEDRMGPWRYAAFYILCGLAAAVAHIVLNADSTVPTIGASGAISGVMGAYYVLYPHARIVVMIPIFFYPFLFTLPAITYLGWWLLIQLFSGVASLAGSAAVGGIAFWAHVGGFVAGMTLLWPFLQPRRLRRPPQLDERSLEHAWHGW
ncbi:MAG: rhomboid family intramembrane serine protease [Planctomycetota bacterium]|nr:MAG: rhomboid family intramembrane serine protease [Planctomycetota bacterium]